MKKRRIIETPTIPPEHLDFTRWPMVFVDSLSPDDQTKYYKRKQAVELYLSGKASVREIERRTDITGMELYRYVRRCLTVDEHGVVMGYRALIPKKRVKKYERVKSIGVSDKLTGAFEALLARYPFIRERMEALYLGRDDRGPKEPIITPKYVWLEFLKACREAGITPDQYPFTTKDRGRRAVERFLKRLDARHFSQVAKRYGEEAARHARFAGKGSSSGNVTIRPFQTVQFDGHRIDALTAIEFRTPEGDKFVKVMDRMWLLTIIDVATRAVLGYHLSFNKEYSAVDVLTCIRNALTPWRPKSFTISGLAYDKSGGFPSGVYSEAEWAAWDEFMIDNGKANLSQAVLDRLTRTINCSINLGPVKVPERRHIIERFFQTLEEFGYHRLPSTTGSGPSDPRRQNAEQKAVKYRISADHLIELTEVLIANYNGEPHSGLNFLSPLEVMAQRIGRKIPIRKIAEEKRRELTLLTLQASRTVRGNLKTGRRPYIEYEGAIYTNEVLARSPELIGKRLTLLVDAEDLRVIRAFLPDGSELGLLQAKGKWGVVPHSLKTRQEINRLRHRKLLHISSIDDPIQRYREYLASVAQGNKSSRNKIARLDREHRELGAVTEHYGAGSTEMSLPEDSSERQVDGKTKSTRLRHTKVYVF